MSQNRSYKYRDVITLICVIVGALISAINIKTFVNAGGLFPGGFTGLTVFIQRLSEKYFDVTLSYSIVNYSLNAIPAYIGFKMVGKKFTMYSIIMILLTGVFVDIIPAQAITEDILLISVFGGIINGVALGIALRGRASSGGTDFISMWISKKTNQSAWNYIMALNGIMLVVAGYMFGWEKALYSIIFQFCSTQIINMMHVRYKRMTMFIVTSQPEVLIPLIQHTTHHGVTQLEGIGTYSEKPRTLLYTVVNSAEVKPLIHLIKESDASAFVNVTKTEQVEGRFYLEPIK